MEYITQVSIGCSGNAWTGYVCDTTIPELVEGAASLGCVFSLIVAILASCFCLIFWLCTYRINRDLTKTYLMPVVAAYTLLLPMELVHSIMLLSGKEESDIVLTLAEGEKYLNNVAHHVVLYCTAGYLVQMAVIAKLGTTSDVSRQIDDRFSYNSIYVIFLITFTILCAGLHTIFPEKIHEFIFTILVFFSIIGYILCILAFFAALTIFCPCCRAVPEPETSGDVVYAGYSRLGGSLCFAQIVLLCPFIQACLLFPWDSSIQSLLINVYILLRFFHPLTVLLSTFLFLKAYRDALERLCSPESYNFSDSAFSNEPIREIQYGGDPAPTTSRSRQERRRDEGPYQARIENVEV